MDISPREVVAPYLGQMLGARFFVDRFVGAGAFAAVLHARAPDGSEAAIKVCLSQEPSAATRFARERKVMAALPRSPHLVAHLGQGEVSDGRPFLAMEYVAGPTLADCLATRERLAPDEAVVVVYQIARALQPLHAIGVVHRDLKPANALVAPTGVIKLFDFGLILDSEGILRLFEAEDFLAGLDFAEDLEAGMVAGTPEYMAVEQFEDARLPGPEGRRTGPAADVFSAAVILYKLIAGHLPFPLHAAGPVPTAPEVLAYLARRAALDGRDVPRPWGVDDWLWRIVTKSLSRDPWERPRDGEELAAALFAYMTGGTARYERSDPPAMRLALGEPDAEETTSLPLGDLFGAIDLEDLDSWDERRSMIPEWHR